MASFFHRFIQRRLRGNAKREGVMAIYLPVCVVEREATSSEDFVEEDLWAIHDACVEAWRNTNRL